MPGFDNTGPEGKGSRTGRGLGKCNPNKSEKEIKNEQDNPQLDGNFGRRLHLGRRKGGQGNGNRFRGGSE